MNMYNIINYKVNKSIKPILMFNFLPMTRISNLCVQYSLNLLKPSVVNMRERSITHRRIIQGIRVSYNRDNTLTHKI